VLTSFANWLALAGVPATIIITFESQLHVLTSQNELYPEMLRQLALREV